MSGCRGEQAVQELAGPSSCSAFNLQPACWVRFLGPKRASVRAGAPANPIPPWKRPRGASSWLGEWAHVRRATSLLQYGWADSGSKHAPALSCQEMPSDSLLGQLPVHGNLGRCRACSRQQRLRAGGWPAPIAIVH